MMTSALCLIFGASVGLSLGLTGGGGAIFAVPLLVYGLGIPVQEAVAISLAAVGALSFVGFLHRWKLRQVEIRTGLWFAVAGMIGAPLGTWIAAQIAESVLLTLFAGLMFIVAFRLWRQASESRVRRPQEQIDDTLDAPSCQRDEEGRLLLNSRCAALLSGVGVLTGVLSGLFGVGGGFVIVPALVLFSGMSIHRAVGTSLMAIALISASGVAAQIWSGRDVALFVMTLFVAGGLLGLFAGQRIAARLPGPVLQRFFAAAILGVAVFVIIRNVMN